MSVRLHALDGANPFAFMAALGTLRVLDDLHHQGDRPRLSWTDAGGWRAELDGPGTIGDVIDAVLEDHRAWEQEPALTFAYGKDGTRCEPDAPGAVRDLKPPPEVMRGFFAEVADRATAGEVRSARHAAAYATDMATDKAGKTKPTALHFTAGQQAFLDAVAETHANLTREQVEEALVGPWTRSSTQKTLGWDPLGAFNARMYALRGSDPTRPGEKRPCVPGAEWLAFVGLSFFPTVPRGRQVLTTCVRGGWKDAVMQWPVWIRPATASTVESLLRIEDIEATTSGQRDARGIGAVYRARILRSDQGGYGAFAPSQPVPGGTRGEVSRRSL